MPRVIGYGGNVFTGHQVVHACDVVWDEYVDVGGDVNVVLDTTDLKVGAGSNRFEMAGPLIPGDILATDDIVIPTLATYTVLMCWAKSSTGTTALDDFRIQLDNDA